jgi:hypothetical protein
MVPTVIMSFFVFLLKETPQFYVTKKDLALVYSDVCKLALHVLRQHSQGEWKATVHRDAS